MDTNFFALPYNPEVYHTCTCNFINEITCIIDCPLQEYWDLTTNEIFTWEI